MRMNRYILKILASVFLLGNIVSGCIREDIGNIGKTDEGVNLVISVSGMGSRKLSRASSDRTDRSRIEDMNIVLVGANDVIKEILYINSEKVTSPSEDENGLVTGELPAENGELTYHVGKTSMEGVSRIFVVCNYWQINKETGEINPEKNNLNNCLTTGTSTVENLKALQQGTPFKPGIMTSTLFGEAVVDEGTDMHKGQIYKCELRRTTAMITVAIETGGTNKLNSGVKITPRSICLHNVPVNCNIGIVNKVETDERIWEEGLVQQVGWDPLVESVDKITVGGHGDDPNIVPLFMFENLQGDNGDENTGEIKKTPKSGMEKYCSYLEVIADYLYTPQAAGENQKYISGPIKYRLYLGENLTTNFDVHRNKHYQVTLSLKGMGGLVEDGRTDKEGNFIGEGADASWRVESSGVTGGGSFLTDGLNMASNGFLDYVGFVKDPTHHYRIYAETDVPWLWSETEKGGNSLVSLSKGDNVIVYEAEQCGGESGVSYIKLFAQPWLDESPYYWKDYGGNTITSWINNGVRKAYMILWDVDAGKEVSRFELRQWLPMPVMVNDSGNPISTGNPNDASFYYSRIDVYEGREIPWGPVFFNNWDASKLQTNKVTYHNGYWGSTRDYNPNYGFDVMAALYATNKGAFNFQNDFGRPGDALGAAIFRAGNAVTSSGGSIKYSFTELSRIGLPTTTEWEKIMKYGVVDVRFGISNVPYWTSTMSGIKSYTYNPISGIQSLENRDTKHRTRLVYHKNDFANF